MSRIVASGPDQRSTALLLLLGMIFAVGTALGFQYIGGYIPCALCLQQRIPYYIGIPLMFVAAVSAFMRGPAWLTRALFLIGGGLMLWGLYLGAYHSGVEWGWWQGPADCGAVPSGNESGSGGVLGQLNQIIPPSCDQAAGRFLGLSFAGWNVVASAILAAIALRGAWSARR